MWSCWCRTKVSLVWSRSSGRGRRSRRGNVDVAPSAGAAMGEARRGTRRSAVNRDGTVDRSVYALNSTRSEKPPSIQLKIEKLKLYISKIIADLIIFNGRLIRLTKQVLFQSLFKRANFNKSPEDVLPQWIVDPLAFFRVYGEFLRLHRESFRMRRRKVKKR